MIKILASIVTLLLMIFPDSGYLLVAQQQLSFPGEQKIAEQIIDAIKDNDVEAIKNMYSEISQSTGEITFDGIENFISSFEGEFEYGKYDGYSSSDKISYGSGVSTRTITIEIKTKTDKYKLFAHWRIVDTENPQKVGLVMLTMWDSYGQEAHEPTVQIPLKESLVDAGYQE